MEEKGMKKKEKIIEVVYRNILFKCIYPLVAAI